MDRSAGRLTIDLVEAVRVPIRARLGELQRAQGEAFVPLVCQEVLRPPDKSSADVLTDERKVIIVPRNAVESCRSADTLKALKDWVETSQNPEDLCHQLELRFSGYDDDPRELWQIEDVRHGDW